jgi:hypothetical protein
MRKFVIVSPGLSVGKPGTHVTADRLNMNDEQLDQFCDVGHAVEIHTPRPPRTSAASRSKSE